MPIVRVSMFEGRSLEKKRRLIEGITDVVAEVCEIDRAGVHVLLDEMSRDNWGRGGVLHRDRQGADVTTSRFGRAGFHSVSSVKTAPGRAAEYLAYRREHVNPTMAGMTGFHASVIARDREDPDRFILFNGWDNEDAWRAYQATPAHDALKGTIRGGLTAEMTIRRYRTVQLSRGGGLDQPAGRPLYMTVSTHRVRPGNEEVYLSLRDVSVHAFMAEFDGFVASNLLESLDETYAFLVVNLWESREAANAYATSRVHYSLRDQVRALLSEHSGTRQYEVVVL